MTEAGPEPEQLGVPVHGGDLAVLRWGADDDGAPLIVLVHGVTANALSWGRVAPALAGEFEVVAPDLRGRAASAGLPGPYGIERHAEDIRAVLHRFAPDGRRRVLVGHSMGAFVTTMAADGVARDAVEGLVLIDGGLALAVPPGADLDDVLRVTLGPSIERLGRTFPDQAAVRDYWADHPAVGPWVDDPVVAAYLARDVVPVEGGLRSAVHPDAVREDSADILFNDSVLEATDDLPVPTTLLWATRGLLDQVPGLYDEVRLAGMGLTEAGVTASEVPGTDHYSILWDEDGVAAVVAAVRAALSR